MQGKCHKSATRSSRKMNERPAPRPKGRNGQTFFLLFHFAHQGGSHSYIPVCKSKPFCAVKIKVEALPHLIFHKVSFNMILAAKLISQDGVHGDRLYPYTVVPGKLIPSQRHGYCRAGCCKSRRQNIHFGCICQRQTQPACEEELSFYRIHHCPAISA